MIVVIADDISGAAELAGVARGRGMSAEVHTVFDPDSTAEVVAVDTDTRSLPEGQAAGKTKGITEEIVACSRVSLIYKKTDSVLRGHVAAECSAVADAAGREEILLVPANPGKGRVIRDGRCFVDEVPLAQTGFARDPEYPARSSLVAELLFRESRVDGIRIEIPDVADVSTLRRQAELVTENVLPAGAAEFFAALLERNPVSVESPLPIAAPRSDLVLMVCGSQAGWAMGRGSQCLEHGVPVVPMPRRLFEDDFEEAELRQWAEEVHQAFVASAKVMIAIGGEKIEGMPPAKLVDRLARAVERVTKLVTIGTICLEGGSTAAQVLQQLNWTRLRPGQALSFGLAPMEVIGPPAPLICIKPGSYPWPDEIWHL